MKAETKTARVSLRVKDQTKEALKKLATAAKREFSDYLRLALEEHVAKAKKAA